MEQGNKTSNATAHTSQTRVGNAISCCAGCACRMAGGHESGDGATLLTKCGENMAVRVNDGSWVIHFGVFEADLRAGELRRNCSTGERPKRPFLVLGMLLGG